MDGDILIDYWPKPDPNRNFDYCAYLDGHEENGPHGYGPSEGIAIHKLIEWMEEME
jgi:hypothetical protein